jgi:hypothetical protein
MLKTLQLLLHSSAVENLFHASQRKCQLEEGSVDVNEKTGGVVNCETVDKAGLLQNVLSVPLQTFF